MNEMELLVDGTVVEANESCLAVEVDGVEVFVGARVDRGLCSDCGDTAELTVSYNRPTEHRVEKHGEEDPLNLDES